jgi:hypothetical protein
MPGQVMLGIASSREDGVPSGPIYNGAGRIGRTISAVGTSRQQGDARTSEGSSGSQSQLL